MPQKKFWRYKLLIYPSFQLTLIAVNLLITLLTFAFVTIQLNRVMAKLVSMGESAQITKDHIYFQFIHWQLKEIYSYLGLAFGLGILSSALITLYLSYKLVGPIVRMRGYFKNIEETGQVTSEISFRKRDFFSELPGHINGALKKLKSKQS